MFTYERAVKIARCLNGASMPIADLSTGVSIYYEVLGSGPPLLLIIGTGGDQTFWSGQLPAYTDNYTVITYDNRGAGRSESPPDPTSYTMSVLADDAAALLKLLKIEKAHVSGISLGSTVAQELAINYPDRVSSLQLHATWGRSDEWFQRMINAVAYPLTKGDLENFVKTDFLWVASPTFLQENPEEVKAIESAYIAENPYPPTIPGLLGHLHADRTHDALDRLHQINVPTLITSGELDWMVPIRYGEQVMKHIPDSRMHIFKGHHSSHMAFIELVDEFNSVTRAFLDEQPR